MSIARISAVAAAAVTAATLMIGTAQAAIIMNGGFEDDAGAAQDGDLFTSLPSGTGGGSWSVFDSLPGWTTTSGPGIEIQTANTDVPVDPHGGDYHVELDSHANSAMKQEVALGIGRYLLSFFYSPRVDNAAADTNQIDYGITDVFDGSVSGPSDGPPETEVGKWTEITMEFSVASAGSYDLVFAAGGKSESLGGFIDDVSIVAVPVPAAGLLLVTALGGAVALRRRKKAAAA